MSDLDKNIHRKEDFSSFEKIIVNPIEKDKQKKEGDYTGLKNLTPSQAFAALTSCFKKILSTFSPKGRSQSSAYALNHLLDNARSFRQLLITLANHDQSHNPDFTEQLTEVWHKLLDDCNSPLSKEDLPEAVRKVKFFISQVQHFPLGADHSLGYYFTEYAGKDWIPFPFMDLLQDLHREFQASPAISVLQNWILLLDDILSD